MRLTFERLVKFDLAKRLEADIFRGDNPKRLCHFLQIVHKLQTADQFIRDCPSYPGSTDKIIRSEMISAIGSTLAIEGGNLAAEEIEESLQKAERHQQLLRSEREAENSRKVYEGIADAARKVDVQFEYREQVIRQIHTWFTDGLNYQGNAPGKYREFEIKFGDPPRAGLCKTEAQVKGAMRNLIEWLNCGDEGLLIGNNIVKAIMSHYYLMEIHPFVDGNGRTARALEALVLYANGINQYCFWSLANFWSIHRAEYIKHLRQIRETCNPWDFLIWGMEGYLEEIQRIRALVLRKLKELMFSDYVSYLSSTNKISERISNTLKLLTQYGRMPLDEFRSSPAFKALYFKLSEPTKYRDSKKMESLQLIHISKENNQKFIEPAFDVLNHLRYR